MQGGGATETVTIYDSNDNAITELPLTREETAQLKATASKGSQVTWTSSDPKVASVVNGLVTALKPGTATITAKVSDSVKASVEVTVIAKQGDVYYDLKFSDGSGKAYENGSFNGATVKNDEFYYWRSADYNWVQCVVTVDYAEYENGTIVVDYSGNTNGNGMQVILKQSADVTDNAIYKLTCNVNTDTAGFVNLNGTACEVEVGANPIEVYFDSSKSQPFNMFMGKAERSPEGTIAEAHIEISDIAWTKDETQVQLQVPTFSIDAEGVITITDEDNDPEGVAEYVLKCTVDGGTERLVTVVSGEKIDVSSLDPGENTVEIMAKSANIHYIDSAWSATNTKFNVENEGGRSYELNKGGAAAALATVGDWAMLKGEHIYQLDGKYDDRANFKSSYAGGKVTSAFRNNESTGNDLQFYYQPKNVTAGEYYQVTLNIETVEPVITTHGNNGNEGAGNVDANAEYCYITICGKKIQLDNGAHEYSVYVKAAEDAPLIHIIMGLPGETENYPRMTRGTVKISDPVLSVATAENLAAPAFTYDDATKTVTITDSANDAAKVAGYEIGLFAAEATEPAVKFPAEAGDTALDLTVVSAGTYTIKVRTLGSEVIYLPCEWAENTTPDTVEVQAQQLADPAFEFDAENVQVKITDATNDSANVAKYVVGLFKNGEETPTYTFDVNKTGEFVGLNKYVIEQGAYEVKVKAVGIGAAYPDSGWVANDTPDEYTSALVLEDVLANGERGEQAAKKHSDEWFVWTDQQGVTAQTGSTDKSFVTVKYGITNQELVWWAVQVFYRDSSKTTGNYNVTMQIYAPKACTLAINGVDKALVVGWNPVTIENYGYNAENCTLNLQFGPANGKLVYADSAESPLTFTIAAVTYTPVNAEA